MANTTETWQTRVNVMNKVNWYFFIFEGLALFIVSFFLLISILKSPLREKDPLYILIVVFMLFYGIFETPLNAEFLVNEKQEEAWLDFFLFCAFYTNFMVHWLFPMQFI